MSKSFDGGHALLIGAGADLAFTIDDAGGVADILKDPGRCAYPPGQVELLIGETAHRQAILDALDRLAERADGSSTVIIYFSGHGYRAITPIGEAYFLIPFGVQMERLKDTAISGSEFASRLQAIRSKKLLLLLDCCHAGGLGLAKGLELAKSPLPPETLEILQQGKGRVIVASCKDNELSYGGKPYSSFTLALIEAFSGQGASKLDGFVRAADLAMHAREKVPGRTKGKQHPILHFEEADNFEIAYYSGGETQPKGLLFAQETEIEPEPGAWRGIFDQRGQTVYGSQDIAGNVLGSVLSGQPSGPVAMGGNAIDFRGATVAIYKPSSESQQIGDRIEIHGDGNVVRSKISVPSHPKIPNASEHLLRLSKLKEWKDMHTETQSLLNLLSNVVKYLDQCQHVPMSYLDISMKSAEQEWGNCSPLLKKLGNTITKFRYIASEDYVIVCLEHSHLDATVSHMIFEAKNSDDAKKIERYIVEVKNDFEAALLIADKEIANLVNEFTSEIAKDLDEVNRRNE